MYKLLLLIIFTISSPGISIVRAQQSEDAVEAKLTDEEIANFRDQAIKSVTDLSRYIKIIADKKQELTTRNKGVDLAIELFASEKNIVQVSSLKNSTKPLKIRAYFNKIKVLLYNSVDITWYDIYLSKEFRQGPDSQYYGTATIFQKFEGNNVETGKYIDITKKSIQIIIKKVKYNVGLTEKERWVLKLGDINVEETK